jgi:hypothetical protein
MVFGFNGLSGSEVSITGSAPPLPNDGQTIVSGGGASTGSTQTIYTCPASTVAYLVRFGYSHTANASARVGYNDGSNKFYARVRVLANTSASLSATLPVYKITEGQTFIENGTSGAEYYYTVIEEAA